MNRYSSVSDDFYVNMNLSTEMELPSSRETVLHFFERIQKKYPLDAEVLLPRKTRFRPGRGQRPGAISLGHGRDPSGLLGPGQSGLDRFGLEQHKLVLELAPFMLSVSPLDCEALDLLFGFDFTYRGNHNQLVAEALGVSPGIGADDRGPGGDGHQLRAVGHAVAGRRLPHAGSAQHRKPHERLSGSHGRISRRPTERLCHGPAIRQPRPGHDVRASAWKIWPKSATKWSTTT